MAQKGTVAAMRMIQVCALTFAGAAFLLGSLCVVPFAHANVVTAPRVQPEPEADQDILEQINRYSTYTDGLPVDDLAELSLGAYVGVHGFNADFYSGAVTQNLGAEIRFIEWTAPVYHLGDDLGAPLITGESQAWEVYTIMPPDFAEQLQSLDPAETLVTDPASDMWWAVLQDSARPFDEYTKSVFPSPVTLSELQQYLLDRYEVFRLTPDLQGGGGAPGLPIVKERARAWRMPDWQTALSSLAVLLAVVAVVQYRRRRTGHSE